MSISVVENQFMWEQKYRPQSIDECILPTKDKKKFKEVVKTKQIKNMLLVSTSPGTGKTTVAKALTAETGASVLFYNTADIGVATIREEIRRFASSMSIEGGRRVVILDEFDRASADLQKALVSFIEQYSSNCSFILTANNEAAFIAPIKSRFRTIKFSDVEEERQDMMKQMIKRSAAILDNEGVKYNLKVVASLVKKNFPDFRSIVVALEDNSVDGVLDEGVLDVKTPDEEIAELIEELKNKKFKYAREMAIKWGSDYPSFIDRLYKAIYKHVEPSSIPTAIECIYENQYFAPQAVSKEIHVVGLLVRLMVNVRWK